MTRTSIQWEDVRHRLRANEESLHRLLSEDPERIQTAYRERAIQLAKPVARKTSGGMAAVIFTVAGERYALPLQELAEVLPVQGCTPVPGSSPSILGVVNLRGEIRPLIDLARVLSAKSAPDPGVALVLRRPLALKVDRIEDLCEIRREELSPAAPGTFIQGMVSGTLAVLDIETILSAVLSRKESQS